MEVLTKLIGNLQVAETDLLTDTIAMRGRGFASDREAWAQLKENFERSKTMYTDAEKVHKEMWESIKDCNGDAFNALAQELEREASHIAAEWITVAALAKLAMMGDVNEE